MTVIVIHILAFQTLHVWSSSHSSPQNGTVMQVNICRPDGIVVWSVSHGVVWSIKCVRHYVYYVYIYIYIYVYTYIYI